MKRTLANLMIGLSLLIAASSGAFAADNNERIRTDWWTNYFAILMKGPPLVREAKKGWRCGVINPDGSAEDPNKKPRWFQPRPENIKSDFHLLRRAWDYEQGWLIERSNYKEEFKSNNYKEEFRIYNHEQAVRLYRRGAERGSATAQISLGMMYANGKGVPRDLREAYKWLTLGLWNYKKETSKASDVSSKPIITADISKLQ